MQQFRKGDVVRYPSSYDSGQGYTGRIVKESDGQVELIWDSDGSTGLVPSDHVVRIDPDDPLRKANRKLPKA